MLVPSCFICTNLKHFFWNTLRSFRDFRQNQSHYILSFFDQPINLLNLWKELHCNAHTCTVHDWQQYRSDRLHLIHNSCIALVLVANGADWSTAHWLVTFVLIDWLLSFSLIGYFSPHWLVTLVLIDWLLELHWLQRSMRAIQRWI